jgi:hypothetical protein
MMKLTDIFLVGLVGLFSLKAIHASTLLQQDTLDIYECAELPVIDGEANDPCWGPLAWQTIDMVWIPWNGSVTEEDFTGKFKVAWSSQTNMLYFLVQVTDDVIVDHYQPGITKEIHQFDIIEVFIDEDRSRGRHVFDTPTENAENAFAYHIWVEFPDQGQVSKNYRVEDLAGTSWNDMISIVYTDHIGDLALKENNKVYTWEFSLKVYDDSYIHSNPEASRVTLAKGKQMGLSLAYCDNDDLNENPAKRDNFYGSVYVPESANNSHWEDAEHFGFARLAGKYDATAIHEFQEENQGALAFSVNHAQNQPLVSLTGAYTGMVSVTVANTAGNIMHNQNAYKSSGSHQIAIPQDFLSGMYFIAIESHDKKYKGIEKFVVF